MTEALPPLTEEEIEQVIEEGRRAREAMRKQTEKLEDITPEDWATRCCGVREGTEIQK